MVSVRLSVRSGVDLGFRTSTDGRTGSGLEIEVLRWKRRRRTTNGVCLLSPNFKLASKLKKI